MRYVERAPSPRLRGVAACVWTYDADAGEAQASPERIVPDGHAELIVHIGDPFAEISPDGARRTQPRAFVTGQMTRPLALDKSSRRVEVIALRFRPEGLSAFAGVDAASLTNRRLPLGDLFPRQAETLIGRLLDARGDDARARVLQNFVLERQGERPADERVADCVRRLRRSNGRLGVGALAAGVGLSTRQLERHFLRHVGVPPAEFADIVRFRSVFDGLNASKPNWAFLAADAGYHDQSHMTRDFKRFVGCAPAAFANELQGLSAALVGLD